MSTHVPGFLIFFQFFLHHFVLAKLATTSIRVKEQPMTTYKTNAVKSGVVSHLVQSSASCQRALYKGLPPVCKVCRLINEQVTLRASYMQ